MARRIHDGRPGAETTGTLPVLITALLPLLGAAAAATTALLAGMMIAIANAGPPAAGMVRLLAWLAYFASPFAGIPVAAHWARRRWSARLDTGTVVLTVLGGLGALCAVIVTLT